MSEAQQPVVAEGAPVLEPLQIGAGLAEELQLHLLELPDAEDEVAGVISLRKDLPIWHTPKGQLPAGGALDGGKLTKMPWAVSGRRYTSLAVSSVTPWKVLNIRLNLRMSVKSLLPQPGQGTWLSRMNATSSSLVMASQVHVHAVLLHIALHQLVRPVAHLAGLAVNQRIVEGGTWPLATHTWGFIKMAESSPTL